VFTLLLMLLTRSLDWFETAAARRRFACAALAAWPAAVHIAAGGQAARTRPSVSIPVFPPGFSSRL
jgi:hypothetical protein